MDKLSIQEYCKSTVERGSTTREWKFWERHRSAWPGQWLFEEVDDDNGLSVENSMPGSFPV